MLTIDLTVAHTYSAFINHIKSAKYDSTTRSIYEISSTKRQISIRITNPISFNSITILSCIW